MSLTTIMCFQSSNIEYVWKFIKGSICHAMDMFIPKVKLRSSKHPRRFNSDIRHHLNCLHSLRRKVKVHTSKLNLMKIKSSEKLLQEKMLSAKKLYESQLTQNFTNMNMLYKYINSVTHQDSIPSTIAYTALLLLHLTMKMHPSLTFSTQFLPKVHSFCHILKGFPCPILGLATSHFRIWMCIQP